MKKPKILLCANSKKENYIAAVEACGAEAVLEYVPEQLDSFYGLILCGGNDVDPSLYGETINGSVNIDYERDRSEFAIAKQFINANKPILGICRGCQMINILFGGTLYQHIETADNHRSASGIDKIHRAHAEKGSAIFNLYGEDFMINSYHHQAIKTLGNGLCITARSQDDIVEAIEHKTLPLIGVQWHPERLCLQHQRPDATDGKQLFQYFISGQKA